MPRVAPFMIRVLSGTLLAAVLAVSPSVHAQKKPINTEFYDDDGNLERIEKDTNRDGKVDQWEHYAGSPDPIRVEKDEDLDGRVDLWQFFDKDTLVRQEQDTSGDGKIDLEAAKRVERMNEDVKSLILDRDQI